MAARLLPACCTLASFRLAFARCDLPLLVVFPVAGTLPLRVSPSKTPVRVDSRRNHDDRNSMLGSLHLTHAAAMQQAGIPAAGLHAGGLQQPLIMPAGLPAAARPGAGLPRAAALPGMLPPGGGQAHVQLPPALLMAVAGLQMGYPGMPSFPL